MYYTASVLVGCSSHWILIVVGTDQTLGGPDDVMDVSNPLSEDLQGSYGDTVDPFLGKLDQESSLACSESLEEPGEDMDRLMLYQSVEAGSSLSTDVLMDNATDDFLEPHHPGEDSPMQHTNLTNNVEISEGQVDRVSLMNVPVVQPDEEMGEKMVKQDIEASETGLEESYVEYTQTSQTNFAVNNVGVNNKDNKDNLLHRNQIKADPSPDSADTSTSSLLVEEAGERKPQELPIKAEELKTEMLPSYNEEIKPLVYAVKLEEMATKAERLDYPIKAERLETKPEDLSLPMKSESLDSKTNIVQFASYADEVKTEAKPLSFGFSMSYPELKTESKPEHLSAFSHTSSVKTETKPEGLDFTVCPDSTETKLETKPEVFEISAQPEIKAETKQELLEADSTVFTPRLDQAEGMNDAPENLVKSQVKEDRPNTPGKNLEASVQST